MKSLIVFYSLTGNTAKLADGLKDYLEKKGDVLLYRLNAPGEAKSFFKQCVRAFLKKETIIKDAPFDVGEFDLICLGGPVWAFNPVPAVRAYTRQCHGVQGKKALVFATYGSGAGKEKCLDEMENLLKKKGAGRIKRCSISQFKVNNAEVVTKEVEKALKEVGVTP